MDDRGALETNISFQFIFRENETTMHAERAHVRRFLLDLLTGIIETCKAKKEPLPREVQQGLDWLRKGSFEDNMQQFVFEQALRREYMIAKCTEEHKFNEWHEYFKKFGGSSDLEIVMNERHGEAYRRRIILALLYLPILDPQGLEDRGRVSVLMQQALGQVGDHRLAYSRRAMRLKLLLRIKEIP